MAQAKEAVAPIPPSVPPLFSPVEEAFDLGLLLDEALAPLRRRATIKRIALSCAVPARLPRLCADRATVLCRVRNLLSQAVEGAERGSSILCAARLGAEGALVVEFQMADYGLEHRPGEGTAGPLGRLLAALRSAEFDICPGFEGRLTVRLRFPADCLRPALSSAHGPVVAIS